MNEDFQKIISKAKEVSLSEAEKGIMLQQINEYIEKTPVRFDVVSTARESNFYFSISALMGKRLATVFAIFMAILLGSISAAAEGALPGEILYPIKVHVNERLSSSLAIGVKSKAKSKVAHVSARLEETEKLAVKDGLTSKAKTQIEINFEKNAKGARKNIANLVERGDFASASEINSDLESSLRSHYDVLVQLSEKNEEVKEDVSLMATVESLPSIAAKSKVEDLTVQVESTTESQSELSKITDIVKNNLTETTALRKESEIKLSAENFDKLKRSAENALKLAENNITEVEKYLSEEDANLKDDVKASAILRLNLAKKYIAEGTVKYKAELYSEAFTVFQRSIRYSKQAKLIANLESNIEINQGGLLKIDVIDSEEVSLLNTEEDIIYLYQASADISLDDEPGETFTSTSTEVEIEGAIKINII